MKFVSFLWGSGVSSSQIGDDVWFQFPDVSLPAVFLGSRRYRDGGVVVWCGVVILMPVVVMVGMDVV